MQLPIDSGKKNRMLHLVMKTLHYALSEPFPTEDAVVSGSSESSRFGWELPEQWYVGIPETRCQYCGLPILFAPNCLGIERCTGDHPNHFEPQCSKKGRLVHIEFSQPVRFRSYIRMASPTRRGRKAPAISSEGSSQTTSVHGWGRRSGSRTLALHPDVAHPSTKPIAKSKSPNRNWSNYCLVVQLSCPETPLTQEIASTPDLTASFVDTEFEKFKVEQIKLLGTNSREVEGHTIRSVRMVDAFTQIRHCQIELGAICRRGRYPKTAVEASLWRADATMMANIEAFEEKLGRAGLTVDLTHQRLVRKQWANLNKALNSVAELTKGTTTPEVLPRIHDGDLPAGFPARLCEGEDGVDQGQWLAELAEFLRRGSEQANYRVQQFMCDISECARTLPADEMHSAICFLCKLLMASGRLQRKIPK